MSDTASVRFSAWLQMRSVARMQMRSVERYQWQSKILACPRANKFGSPVEASSGAASAFDSAIRASSRNSFIRKYSQPRLNFILQARTFFPSLSFFLNLSLLVPCIAVQCDDDASLRACTSLPSSLSEARIILKPATRAHAAWLWSSWSSCLRMDMIWSGSRLLLFTETRYVLTRNI